MLQASEQVFPKGLQPWNTCAGAEEKSQKDGEAEKNQNIQTTSPPCAAPSHHKGTECTCCDNKGEERCLLSLGKVEGVFSLF